MTPKQAKRRKERGAAAIELAIAAPLLVILGGLGLDLGAYMYTYAQADSAATAAARYVMDHADASVSTSDVQAYLADVFPELGFGSSSAVTSLTRDTRHTDDYSYHIYDGTEEKELAATDSYQSFSVSVDVSAPWPALPGLIGGDSGTFSVDATAAGSLDRTPSDGTWEVAA